MQLLSFETAAWGSPLPSQVGQRIPQHSRHGEATRLLCPYPCTVLPQESGDFPPISDFSLPFPPGCRHSPTALICSCSSYKTPSSAWGSPSCCLHLTHWFRGIWSIKKPHRSKTQTAPCVNAQNVLLDQCPKAQISCPSIVGASRLSLALNHYYFSFLFLRNRGFQLQISHTVDHLTIV